MDALAPGTMAPRQLIRLLRRVSVVEATSYLLLLIATVVKQTGGSETGVSILGPIHGILFLAFAGLVLLARGHMQWPLMRTILALIIGSLPLGGYWLDRNWLAEGEREFSSTSSERQGLDASGFDPAKKI